MTLEEMQAQMLKLQEEITTLKASNNDLQTKNQEITAKNEKLVEHNNMLFSRISSPVKENTAEDKTDEEIEDDLVKEIREIIKNQN